jgi:hypothetical protein
MQRSIFYSRIGLRGTGLKGSIFFIVRSKGLCGSDIDMSIKRETMISIHRHDTKGTFCMVDDRKGGRATS